jgi:dissimilatory sulfite reductase (desulfoviridin) alpha/beta subunit
MTVNVTGGFSQNPGEANLAPMLERYEHTTCYPGPGCLAIEARQVVLNQETCPASGSCTSTFNLVALASAMANDKIVMMVGGIAGASYSISGTYTISKE